MADDCFCYAVDASRVQSPRCKCFTKYTLRWLPASAASVRFCWTRDRRVVKIARYSALSPQNNTSRPKTRTENRKKEPQDLPKSQLPLGSSQTHSAYFMRLGDDCHVIAYWAGDDQKLENNLPPCLELRSDRAIVIAGHRVTLFTFLTAVKELERNDKEISAAILNDIFPSLPLPTIVEVLKFSALQPSLIEQYFTSESAIALANAPIPIQRAFPRRTP